MVLPRDGGGGGDSEWARTERAKGVVHEAAPTLEATCKWGPRTTGTSARLTTSLGVPTTPASGLTSLQNNSELRQTLYLQFIVKDANKQVKRQMHKAGGARGGGSQLPGPLQAHHLPAPTRVYSPEGPKLRV